MDEEDKGLMFITVIVALLMVGITTYFISSGVTEDKYRQAAIERGFAEYNQQTGEWQWKEGE